MSPLWLLPRPLLLASGSTTRRQMLTAAGIPCEAVPPKVDERAVEAQASARGVPPPGIAAVLAAEKALAVSRDHPGRIVLGADQTLTLDGTALHKPQGREDAARQLRTLAGRTHELRSAAAVARDGAILFETETVARLHVRDLSAEAIGRYLDAAGPAVAASVGGYQVEGAGVTLFETIEGDHFTILGLPLLPLLAWWREQGWMP